MIPIPSPPTDNLYKFIAIAGLLMLGVGIVTPFFIEQEAFDSRVRRFRESEDRYREVTLKLGELSQRDNLTGDERAKQIENLNRAFAQIIDGQVALTKLEDAEQRQIAGRRVWWLSAMATAGGALMAFGFVAWWVKVQRLQDQILAAELDKALREAKDAKSRNGTRK